MENHTYCLVREKASIAGTLQTPNGHFVKRGKGKALCGPSIQWTFNNEHYYYMLNIQMCYSNINVHIIKFPKKSYSGQKKYPLISTYIMAGITFFLFLTSKDNFYNPEQHYSMLQTHSFLHC